MENEIKKLIKIAEKYYQHGLNTGVISHVYLREKIETHDKPSINIYIADGNISAWHFYYDKIEVVGYASQVKFPFDITKDKLKTAIEDMTQYFHEITSNAAKPFAIKRKCLEDKLRNINTMKKEAEKELNDLNKLGDD